jgi:glutamate-1-semialdehyde 2,1-aminomutase
MHKEETMTDRDYAPLVAELAGAYERHAPRSQAIQADAAQLMIDGGNHTLRLMQPFPPRIKAARGARLTDEDGHELLDFWQGHLANVLGHNPPVVTAALAQGFQEGFGLQTGFTDALQVDVARLLLQQTGAERVRLTTSGTLATMYAIMLARAFTGRNLVLKVGGGWHGGQPWALKGIDYRRADGYDHVESAGIPQAVTDEVVVTSFNDPERLREDFRRLGDRLACLIVEPFIGVGGFMPATREYLATARQLTEQYGALLILDEVIAGFRFRAGNAGALYGLQPDLTTMGKVIGGGMPVAAVVGRADVLGLAGRGAARPVKFSGGTYSAHPASMLAARTAMTYLIAHEAEIYPRLGALGNQARHAIEAAFAEEGICVKCTGAGNEAIPASSMFMLHFPTRDDAPLDRPEDLFDPAKYDVTLSHHVLDLALLVEDVFMLHSHGGLSTAHSEADIAFLSAACRRVARKIKPYL